MAKYQPRNSFESPRFCGPRTFMRLPFIETADKDMDFIITGVPFDSGQSFRTGSRFGPEAIRDFSILLRPYNPEQDINLFDYISGVDYGDIPVVPGYIQDTYEKIEAGLTPVVEQGIIPIVLGGDHSITLGELRAIAKKHGPVALLQFDAHSDTWDSHQRIGSGPAFLSFDIDFLDPAFAPGTGTPEVSGASIDDALAFVRGLTGINFVGFDLVEVLPAYDHGQITAAAAANIVFEFVTQIALQKRAAQAL